MFFLGLAAAFSMAAFAALRFLGRADLRAALRVGISGAFLFTGVDHFLSTQSRYAAMMPPYLEDHATVLILVSGALQIAAAIAMLFPLGWWQGLGLPNLRPVAGIGLAMLLSVLVVANGHMAGTGTGATGLSSDPAYLTMRVFLQPFILLWVLFASGAIFPPEGSAGTDR